MDRVAKRVLTGILTALLGGCGEVPYVPNWIFQGTWVDIDGRDRTKADACAGTFEYIDAYAGALAVEFGVTAHLGSYRWYSPEEFDAELPCGGDAPYPYACAHDNHTLNTAFMPHEHEVVHLANFATGMCPNFLAEGLAEYYGTNPQTPAEEDLEALVARIQAPAEKIPNSEYAIAGRFVAYLVEQYGLHDVLEVCRASGRHPDAEMLATAIVKVFGASAQTVVADFAAVFAEGPSACNSAAGYQSRVFACGIAEAARDIGVVDEAGVDVVYDFGCAAASTVGPFIDTIKIVERANFGIDGTYEISTEGEEIFDVELTIAECGPCGAVRTFTGEVLGAFAFDAGRYSIELRAPATYSGSVTLHMAAI